MNPIYRRNALIRAPPKGVTFSSTKELADIVKVYARRPIVHPETPAADSCEPTDHDDSLFLNSLFLFFFFFISSSFMLMYSILRSWQPVTEFFKHLEEIQKLAIERDL